MVQVELTWAPDSTQILMVTVGSPRCVLVRSDKALVIMRQVHLPAVFMMFESGSTCVYAESYRYCWHSHKPRCISVWVLAE